MGSITSRPLALALASWTLDTAIPDLTTFHSKPTLANIDEGS
jgi:hypothetical protein